MVDESKITAAIQEFCKNKKWKELFEKAPGGAMERLAISFYLSEYGKSFSEEELAEYRSLRDEIEKTLDKEDLEYLINNVGKDKSVSHYKELLESLPPEGPAKSEIGGGLTKGEPAVGGEQGNPSPDQQQAQQIPTPDQGNGAMPGQEKPQEEQEKAQDGQE